MVAVDAERLATAQCIADAAMALEASEEELYEALLSAAKVRRPALGRNS